MKVLSDAEAKEILVWSSGDISRDIQLNGKCPVFSHPEASRINIEYPSKVESLPFFAHSLATLCYGSEHFEGALLWFTEWGVWNSRDEGVGYRVVEAMHTAAGQPKSFEAAPGHLFRADELNEAVGMLLQPMIFGWDAIFVPRWSYGGTTEFLLRVSHDSFVTLITRTEEFRRKASDHLRALKILNDPPIDSASSPIAE
jgi:hypothetical protein